MVVEVAGVVVAVIDVVVGEVIFMVIVVFMVVGTENDVMGYL